MSRLNATLSEVRLKGVCEVRRSQSAAAIFLCVFAITVFSTTAHCDYIETFNDDAGGWASFYEAATWSPTGGIGGTGAIECKALSDYDPFSGQYYLAFQLVDGTGTVNFNADPVIEAYFLPGSSCKPQGGQLYFYLGNNNTQEYFYYNAEAAFFNDQTWDTPTILTLTSSSTDWTWMGTGPAPAFSDAWLNEPTEFGWALVGALSRPSGKLRMDNFSATPGPAATVLFPIGLAAMALWRHTRRRAQ